jgi:hypothetical protein
MTIFPVSASPFQTIPRNFKTLFVMRYKIEQDSPLLPSSYSLEQWPICAMHATMDIVQVLC